MENPVKLHSTYKKKLLEEKNMKYNKKWRCFLFLALWVGWFIILIYFCVNNVQGITSAECPPVRVKWFLKSAIYQLDVATFKDSDGDGIGDFVGLTSKLDYLKNHNIHALMLKSFYNSSAGGGIVDHTAINSTLGSLEDFDTFVKQLKEKGMQLIIEFNPNHSSDDHPFFIDSSEGSELHKDFYVWIDSAQQNNWLNIDGSSAWTWHEKRKQYYFSAFGNKLPEFNLRNENVTQMMKDILKFWLERGVDGFNVAMAAHLVEDKNLRSEPAPTVRLTYYQVIGLDDYYKIKYRDMKHIYTIDQPENFDLLLEWRKVLDSFSASTGIPKILIPEISGSLSLKNSSLYYGNKAAPITELAFIKFLAIGNFYTESQLKTTKNLQDYLMFWKEYIPDHASLSLLVGSESVPRLASRVEEKLVDGIHMVILLSKSTPILYYGDELGISNYTSKNGVSMSNTVMLWNSKKFSGFTDNNETSLPLHPAYYLYSVFVQERNQQSHLSVFTKLLALRNTVSVAIGFQDFPLVTEEVFSLARFHYNNPGYLVVVNLSTRDTVANFTNTASYLPVRARVEVRSSNIKTGPLVGDRPYVFLDNLPLKSKEGVVLSFYPASL